MNPSIHEPKATLMSTTDVWEDAQTLSAVLRKNLLKTEPVIQFPIPLSLFLEALDNFGHDELLILRQRVEEKLAV